MYLCDAVRFKICIEYHFKLMSLAIIDRKIDVCEILSHYAKS